MLEIGASVGFKWAATDNGVLERTLRRAATPDVTYRPWLWSQHGREMRMIFRDHLMSDLIGFVYSGMGAANAAQDFLHRIYENCRGLRDSGRDALVPIILDGENAWEYYDRNGRPFFRELYSRIQKTHIFPGSWINANFDVWIGAEEDNKSCRLLLDAHKAYDRAQNVPEPNRRQALEELLIAEGSDWNWWYGPEHETANAIEFDQIYREHLSNVYRALGAPPPPELSQPILHTQSGGTETLPSAPISPTINGVVDSYFGWLGAGTWRAGQRSGSMHGKRILVKAVHYGANDTSVSVRVDFEEARKASRVSRFRRCRARIPNPIGN